LEKSAARSFKASKLRLKTTRNINNNNIIINNNNITRCLRASFKASIFLINAQINIKMEGLYHKSQRDLPNKMRRASFKAARSKLLPLHFDIDLCIEWKN
jgi:hypothetical protein